jgi:hypothetical protein
VIVNPLRHIRMLRRIKRRATVVGHHQGV